jgi:hypothetical protein
MLKVENTFKLTVPTFIHLGHFGYGFHTFPCSWTECFLGCSNCIENRENLNFKVFQLANTAKTASLAYIMLLTHHRHNNVISIYGIHSIFGSVKWQFYNSILLHTKECPVMHKCILWLSGSFMHCNRTFESSPYNLLKINITSKQYIHHWNSWKRTQKYSFQLKFCFVFTKSSTTKKNTKFFFSMLLTLNSDFRDVIVTENYFSSGQYLYRSGVLSHCVILQSHKRQYI